MDQKEILWADYRKTGAALKAFPKSNLGLTPDAIKATKEWKEAKRAYESAFAKLRAFNSSRA